MRTGSYLLLFGLAGCFAEPGLPGATDDDPGLAAPTGVRRLTAFEYDNTVRDLLSDPSGRGVALLPEDKRTPFDNDIATQVASNGLVEALELLANEAAQRLVADPARFDGVVGCRPAPGEEDACLEDFVRRFGRRALRRPLTASEVSDFVELGRRFLTMTGAFEQAVEVVVRAFLLDAELAYRVEHGTAAPEAPGLYTLNGFERATRLSYLLWATGPDDALLDLAAAGALDSPAGLRAAAVTMLEDPRARAQVERFHALWLGYDRLPHRPELSRAMRAETNALIDRVVFDRPSSWLELFTADETFVDATLAGHYGLPAPAGPGPGWVPYDGTPRRGLLSHGAFLSVGSNPTDTSPTRRGKLIRNRLLCQDIPPPPPDVVIDNGPTEVGECKLDNYRVHGSAGCQSCHRLMDPIGFGLEQYDREGRFRTHEEGKPQCPIDGRGELVEIGTFTGPAELQSRLLETGALEACAVQKAFSYAMGRQVTREEHGLLRRLQARFQAGDYRFDALLLAVVESPAFGQRVEEGSP